MATEFKRGDKVKLASGATGIVRGLSRDGAHLFVDTGKGVRHVKRADATHVAKERTSFKKPFAGYKNFADCVKQNQDKGDPEAYCARIEQQTQDEDEKAVHKKPVKKSSREILDEILDEIL